MQRLIRRTGAYAAALAVLMLAPCRTLVGQEFAGREKLRAHSDEFSKDVIRVTDGVYVAVGYSASNVTLIQGDRGSIVVDTSTDPVDARAIRTAFGDLLGMPVRAIVYTHSHGDHTGGARVFAGNDNPEVLARGRDALAARDFKWAAELADYVLANDSASAGAKRIKAQALIELGERQINAIARNYYLSAAQYLLRDLPPPVSRGSQ